MLSRQFKFLGIAMLTCMAGSAFAQSTVESAQSGTQQFSAYNAFMNGNATIHSAMPSEGPGQLGLNPVFEELPPIAESNILYKNRIWRDITEMAPEQSADCPYSSRLGTVLIHGALSGKIKAYSAENFTGELTREQLITILNNNQKTLTSQPFGYKIKEDWLYLKEEKKMVVRIVGIAPTITATQPPGTSKEQILFWVFYPESRDFLAEYKVITPDDKNGKAWVNILDGRDFKSKITKVSVNRGDKQLVSE